MHRTIVLLIALATAACLSTHAARPRSEWKNLRVLPANMPHDDLIALMRGWSQSLGVECGHCHTPYPGADGRLHLDFVSDAQPPKNLARAMVRMTTRMDADVAGIARNGGTVSCYTCHRGKVTPDWKLPPQPKA